MKVEDFKRSVDYPMVFGQPEIRIQTETVLENDIYVDKVMSVVVDPAESLSPYKVSDFSINHLRAAGAVDMLKPVGQYGSVGLDQIDAVGNSLPVEDDKNIEE